MAEYRNFGPGWNETARRDGNVTLVLSEDMYQGYDRVEKVFQYPFEGRFGNTAWIDGDL
ncbi:hypothetical protein PtrM4_081080 [Pyrenophora tritici-repentis]|nr:hypothetical protein PtrM4_081080 [Pyrenophora tritici-repentis]